MNHTNGTKEANLALTEENYTEIVKSLCRYKLFLFNNVVKMRSMCSFLTITLLTGNYYRMASIISGQMAVTQCTHTGIQLTTMTTL